LNFLRKKEEKKKGKGDTNPVCLTGGERAGIVVSEKGGGVRKKAARIGERKKRRFGGGGRRRTRREGRGGEVGVVKGEKRPALLFLKGEGKKRGRRVRGSKEKKGKEPP